MPIPEEARREPLLRMLCAQQISDSEMRTILRDSAREAEALVARYGDTFSSHVRHAQLDIAQQQAEMWRKVGYQAEINIGDGVDAASDSLSFLTELHMSSVGMTVANVRHAIMAQGRGGIESLISRGSNGIPLAQSVYKTSVASGEQLDRTVNAMLTIGASAREIATAVHKFIDPLTPGGASYAAMRLGRSELNNAFHRTSIDLNNASPFVEAMQWNLSGSHPKPDECNEYADRSHFKGGSPGVFQKGEVPAKPHPNCFCFVTPVVVDDDEFVKNFHAGKYDDYTDGHLGCSRA